jgi:exodeoxyribonuclease V alpha subunit
MNFSFAIEKFLFMTTQSPFNRLDNALANFLAQRSSLNPAQRFVFAAIVARLSFAQSQGHCCILLTADEQFLIQSCGLALAVEISQNLAVTEILPLVLQEDCLYTQRYWFYETRLALQVKQRLQCSYPISALETALDKHFPALAQDEFDWQRAAAKLALTQAFAIVTGGPGTGKTTTVVKILALLQELAAQPLQIALAAPTGKAAMRLQESIGNSIKNLSSTDEIKRQIPDEVKTLHRLLGARPPSPYFQHDANKPLPYDVVVIDEASMVDLALMSKLVDALKQGARLILLGDKDQLASVESGAVLADLTASLPQHTVELQKSHRFHGKIKDLAVAVNQQQGKKAWDLLMQGDEQISLLTVDTISYIAQKQQAYLSLVREQADFKQIFAEFNQFQVLCANRQGENSINDINHRVEKKLQLSGHWYNGRPVMMIENNAAMQLYNGDIGLCLADKTQNNRLMVFFLRPDGSVKKVLPTRLPPCETVFAMTIHKSQGSEFEEVLIALPDKMNPVLTKELIYTAITRAKKTVKVVATADVFIQATAKKIQRIGGLAAKLQK